MQGWWDAELSPHIEISLPTGETIDLVVDSGFNGEVVLPKSLIPILGLQDDGSIFSRLADGSVVETELYIGEILWFGQRREVRIQATDSHEGLLGTELFQGCIVELDLDANRVTFRKKPAKKQKP
jgi:clan AA aspartic protease